ncbi:hypothetical protein ACTQ2N_11265 [Ruminococcus sp. LCP21S3_E8]
MKQSLMFYGLLFILSIIIGLVWVLIRYHSRYLKNKKYDDTFSSNINIDKEILNKKYRSSIDNFSSTNNFVDGDDDE